MKPAASLKAAKLLLPSIAVALVAYLFYSALQPPPSVHHLIQTVNRYGSYQELERAIDSNDQKERLAAVQASLVLQTDEAFRLLNKAIGDRSIVVRVSIVQRLADLPEPRALPLIFKLLDDREFGIVRDSIAALQKHTGRDYKYRFESSPEEKLAVIAQCKRDINERLKLR